MTRLIDADALDQAMYHKAFEVYDGRTMWNSGCWIRYKIYEEASREAPTIEAVPVRHGKWITKSTGGEYFDCCSECGYVEWGDPNKYCPNCGAKMDAEREEE